MTREDDEQYEDSINCPVCQAAGRVAAIGSQGMVVAAAEALINGDDALIGAATANSNPYDFHMAVTMYVESIYALSDMLGIDVRETLKDMRAQLNEAYNQ